LDNLQLPNLPNLAEIWKLISSSPQKTELLDLLDILEAKTLPNRGTKQLSISAELYKFSLLHTAPEQVLGTVDTATAGVNMNEVVEILQLVCEIAGFVSTDLCPYVSGLQKVSVPYIATPESEDFR
jgi:hypothetical protein